MASIREKICNQVDRMLIEACQNAEERICAAPAACQQEYSSLSEQARCALIFIKQWAADAKLPLSMDDLDTALVLQFARTAPAGPHVHQRILQGLICISATVDPHSSATPAESESLSRIRTASTDAHRVLISSAFQTVRDVMILLEVERKKSSIKLAVFLLAKLLDPELGA